MEFIDYILVGIIILILLFLLVKKTIKSWLIKQKFKTARKKEKDAVKFLKKQGFRIIDLQKKVSYITKVNGKQYQNYVQVDMIVEKYGKKYIAEVKTGKKATRPNNPRTRRQLLEYFFVYKPDGILLVDMTNKRIKQIDFEIIKPTSDNANLLLSKAIIFLFGIITGLLMYRGLIK